MPPELWHGQVVDGHLGGYVADGDPMTWCPELWEWFTRTANVRTALDVGCGDGRAVDWLNGHGIDAIGVDGMPVDHPHVVVHDFTTGPWPPLPRRRDMVWSCEFVEHVEEQHMPNFLEAFKVGCWVLMTHAVPGQGGWHHVNCRTPDYWVGALAAIGHRFNQEMTDLARQHARGTYFELTGMVFHRA